MKAAKVLYLKKTQSHFNEAMRLNGERDGIAHACAEIAAYIDAHQAAGVYLPGNKSAVMYCAGVKIILKRMLPYLWIIVAVKFIGHMPVSFPVYVLRRVRHGAYEHFRRAVDHWRWQELPVPRTTVQMEANAYGIRL